MRVISYDTDQFNFSQLIQNYFFKEKNIPLELIHTAVDDNNNLLGSLEILTREKDQSTYFHKKFYEFSRTQQFIELYESFIKKIVRPLYQESIVYQTIPTFRIQMPGNLAVGEFHKDKNYRDVKWAETVKEDNFYFPFTNAFDTNTIWVESEEDKGDFCPMECKHGEIIQWDGSNLTHGNKLNVTGVSRVSTDFRVIKYSNYVPNERGSINMKSKFKIGEYYKLCE